MARSGDPVQRPGLLLKAAPLIFLPMFIGGLYFAAKTGIELADRQVPPGSRTAAKMVEEGTRWSIAKPGLAIASKAEDIRDFDFQRSGSGGAQVAGVTRLEDESVGWDLQVQKGGDQRYLKIKFLSGDRQGDEAWVIAEQIVVLGKRAKAG
jgi:hypothetical protein